jgi:hypothetical protein
VHEGRRLQVWSRRSRRSWLRALCFRSS